MFLLFGGQCFYPSGGWGDFIGSYSSLEAVQTHDVALVDCEWAQVVDAATLKVVAEAGREPSRRPGQKEGPLVWKIVEGLAA